MAQTILALGSLMPKEMEALESHFSIIRLWKEKDPEATLQKYKNEITGVVSTWETPVSERLIAALPNLEIISQCAVGIDNIDLKAAKARRIIVTNTPGVLTDDTADIALALILATARRIVEADMYVRVGKWLNGDMPLGTSVSGKTAGIIGMGRIGRAIAKRCEAFNMKIIYNGPHKKDVPYEYYKDLKVMAAASDFLVVACSGGAPTQNLVDYKVLESLGPKGIVINIARGSVINEGDLLIALSNKIVGGAGLDVHAKEPHVPEALFSMDNVVLLPHIGSATHETRGKMSQLVVDNLLAHFSGQPLKTPVAA